MDPARKKTILFAPCAYNLAETTRMLEIAKAVRAHERASAVFAPRFISDGGEFERLVEEAGFPLEKLEPQLTPEKIQRIYKLDKGEALGAAFSARECIEKIDNELAFISKVEPAAIVTGSYPTMPLTHRIAGVPLVWVVQSTWLEPFFKHGAGMTDTICFPWLKKIADFLIFEAINLWMRVGLLNPLNKAAKHYGVPGFKTMFEFWRGDLNLVAEPEDFTGAKLPPDYRFVGPIIARQDFPVPQEVRDIPRDRPLVYFAMGSSGTPEIIRNIMQSFAGKPYRVIAPMRSFVDRLPPFPIPENVVVTGWLPALEVNTLADISLIHGGIGTVMTAALAGKPIVGVGMSPEQSANLAALERKGFAVRVAKSKDPSRQVQEALRSLLADATARQKAEAYAEQLKTWDGPGNAAETLWREFGPGERA